MRIILRDSILLAFFIFIALWSIPLLASLFSIGSSALVIPILIAAVLLYLVLSLVSQIHNQMEQEFRRTLLGKETLDIPHEVPHLGIRSTIPKISSYIIKLPMLIIRSRAPMQGAEIKATMESGDFTDSEEKPARYEGDSGNDIDHPLDS